MDVEAFGGQAVEEGPGEVGLSVGVEGGPVVLVLEVVEDYGCEGRDALVEGGHFGVSGVVSFEFGSVEG